MFPCEPLAEPQFQPLLMTMRVISLAICHVLTRHCAAPWVLALLRLSGQPPPKRSADTESRSQRCEAPGPHLRAGSHEKGIYTSTPGPAHSDCVSSVCFLPLFFLLNLFSPMGTIVTRCGIVYWVETTAIYIRASNYSPVTIIRGETSWGAVSLSRNS